MGREYGEYPAVDRTRVRDGYQMCLANARRLMNDATILREAGRLRTAYIILFLAVEELGNAMQLYEAGRSGVHNWEEWWGRYFRHPREQESASLEIVGMELIGERFAQVREELMYVNFDEKDERFISPREDGDIELVNLFEQGAAHVEGIIKALPSYAFERLELEEMAQRSPEIVAPALYTRIEEIVSQEPGVSEKDLLTAIAHDLGMSLDDFATGYERWKKVSPKARTYMDLLQRVQSRLKKERQQKEAERTG